MGTRPARPMCRGHCFPPLAPLAIRTSWAAGHRCHLVAMVPCHLLGPPRERPRCRMMSCVVCRACLVSNDASRFVCRVSWCRVLMMCGASCGVWRVSGGLSRRGCVFFGGIAYIFAVSGWRAFCVGADHVRWCICSGGYVLTCLLCCVRSP
jgi:hypothetical protein